MVRSRWGRVDVICGEKTFSIFGRHDNGKEYIRERGIDSPMMNMPVVQKSMACIVSVAEVRVSKQVVSEDGLAMMAKCWRKTEVACLSCLARARAFGGVAGRGPRATTGSCPFQTSCLSHSTSCQDTIHHGDDDE